VSRLLPVTIALPLLSTALTFVGGRPLRRTLSFATSGAVLLFGIWLVAATRDGTVLATQVGGWPAPYAIPLAVDALSALMLTVSAFMVLLCTTFAVSRGEDEHPLFHSVLLGLSAGLYGSFATADLFNLFVCFEIMLISSYVLIVLGGTAEQVRAGAVYVTTNMLASFVLLTGVALLYGEAGSVNIAELASATRSTGSVAVAAGLLLAAFAVKAALVPVHGWLPYSYPAASPAVAALFSGLLTKVGLYAIYRVYATVFAGEPAYRTPLLVAAALSMVFGVFGAVGRDGMREILSFHIVSQVGYILAGVGLFGPLGLAAGIFYMLHHVIVKTGLFLTAGAVETLHGTGLLSELGGLARRRPLLASAFMACALSLAGLPPFSGFFGKLALVQAAFSLREHWIAAVMVVVSLFTLLSMIKIWTGVFWGEDREPAPIAGGAPEAEHGFATGGRRSTAGPAAVMAPALVCATSTILIGLAAAGLYALSLSAAEALVDTTAYVEAVLGR